MESDDIEVAARQRVGAVLRGKWRLDRLLGVGGMAAVYAGTHRNGSKGAIKILHPFIARSGDVRARFLREGYVANQVEHRGSVRVIDDDATEDGVPFLVLELLEGAPLDKIVERSGGKLDPRIVLAIGSQLTTVLAAAHAKGIVHRDVKPENLFITREGQLKLLDFGIARIADATANATRTGVAMGTPAYMAPEQALGRVRDIDARTDIYSVGAVMFGLLAGRGPHEGESANELMIKVATQPAPPLRSIAPSVHEDIAAIVDGALRTAREERWPTAADMMRAITTVERDRFGANAVAVAMQQLIVLASAPPAIASTMPMDNDASKIVASLKAEAAARAQNVPPTVNASRVPPTVMGTMGPDAMPPRTAYGEPLPAVHSTPRYGSVPSSGAGSTQYASPSGPGATQYGEPSGPSLPHETNRSAPGFAAGSGIGSPPSVPQRSGTPVAIAVACVAIVLIGGGVWVATKGGGSPIGFGGSTDAAPSGSASAASASGAGAAGDTKNRFVRITPKSGVRLGVDAEDAPATTRGFRPSRKVSAPSSPYELQQHEVTWGELSPWLSKKGIQVEVPSLFPSSDEERADFPAAGVPWETARAYCKESVGGDLPTEEQWEYAARGAELRRYPWGDETPDFTRTHAFDGDDGKPVKVMTSDQDKTPGDASESVHDLAGNVQEWTLSLWRSDSPADDDSWVQGDDTSARSVRGWPLLRPIPKRTDGVTIAWRDWVCTGTGSDEWKGVRDAAPRLRAARFEVWAQGSPGKPLPAEARRAFEDATTQRALGDCLQTSDAKTLSLTLRGAKGPYCNPGFGLVQTPDGPMCDSCPGCNEGNTVDPLYGPTLSLAAPVKGKADLSKCIGTALTQATQRAKLPATMGDGEQTYDMYLTKSAHELLPTIGFRCARPAK